MYMLWSKFHFMLIIYYLNLIVNSAKKECFNLYISRPLFCRFNAPGQCCLYLMKSFNYLYMTKLHVLKIYNYVYHIYCNIDDCLFPTFWSIVLHVIFILLRVTFTFWCKNSYYSIKKTIQLVGNYSWYWY